MENLENSLKAFDRLLESISDEELDEMLAKIDSMGISGPSVDEYFQSINKAVSSFYDEASETSTLKEVEQLFSDTRIKETCDFRVPVIQDLKPMVPALKKPCKYYAGESDYSMAA